MGKASARSILSAGGKVVLVSRTAAKLDAAKAELVAQTGCDPIMVEVEACNCFEVRFGYVRDDSSRATRESPSPSTSASFSFFF